MTNITAFANEEFIAKRKETVKEISADLLKVLHKDSSSELQDKVENNFEALTGKPWMASDELVKPTLIIDPPGTGRNAVFLEAAKSVAKGLGLNFEVNPPKEFAAISNDIVLLNIEVSDDQTPSFGSSISTTAEDAQQQEDDHIKHINRNISRNKDALAAEPFY